MRTTPAPILQRLWPSPQKLMSPQRQLHAHPLLEPLLKAGVPLASRGNCRESSSNVYKVAHPKTKNNSLTHSSSSTRQYPTPSSFPTVFALPPFESLIEWARPCVVPTICIIRLLRGQPLSNLTNAFFHSKLSDSNAKQRYKTTINHRHRQEGHSTIERFDNWGGVRGERALKERLHL